MSTPSALVVFCTFPDLPAARQVGTAVVEKQLAACVNLVPAIESIYRWKGEVERDQEVLAIFKTSAEGFPGLQEALLALHPYEVPEVLALPVVAGSEAYLDWLGRELAG